MKTRAKMYSQILRAFYIIASRQWIGKDLKTPLEFIL